MQMARFGCITRAVVAASFVGVAFNPAMALDDDGHESLFKTFTGLLSTGIGVPGLTPSKDTPAINYRERAPLVLPKQQTLRTPLPPVASRNQAWPKDYDKQKVRRASRASGDVARDDAGNEILSARYLRDTGRLANAPRRNVSQENCENPDPLQQPCNIPDMWRKLKNTRLKEDTKDLIPGQEPQRKALTDPPPGLRVPSRRVKYTFEAAKDKPEVPDPREAIREEAKRDAAYR